MRLVLLLLAIAVLFSMVSPMAAAEPPGADVRILLTAFQQTNSLKVAVYGNYSLDNRLSFQRGSVLEIFLIHGQLMLHYEGMSYSAGKNLKLIRHAAAVDEENGLRLQDDFSLYTGDLSISVKDQHLFPVLTVPIEEYLYGVVPYEMADEFPMEALKAQAIAARTYTIANLKPDEDYDLVDNTNDQVYRGLNIGKKNAIQAVTETKGVVCTYQGQMAVCLYTASNGGFTESAYNAWGREKIPYLIIQEDRYDVENPLSIVRKAKISKVIKPDATRETELLTDYLRKKVASLLLEDQQNMENSTFEIKEIRAIKPHTSKYDGAEGVMKTLRFDLLVDVTAPSLETEDTEINLTNASEDTSYQVEKIILPGSMTTRSKEISVDCPVFPDIEQLLSLSINRYENEIVSIAEERDAFSIQFARYGHGVGMSQRGAEWMAKQYGWSFQQILRFYYPGTELKTLQLKPRDLAPLDVLYLTTPGPSPSPTPRPTLMPQSRTPAPNQRIVYVTGVSKDSSLNLRTQPDLLSDILARLYYGQELLVLDELDDGWLQVQTDDAEGFVRSEYVSNAPADGP